MKTILSASILAANHLSLYTEIEAVRDLVDELHLDICDGNFVPSISFGAAIAQSICRDFPAIPLDVHLMVTNPHFHLQSFMESAPKCITFHYEASLHPLVIQRTIAEHNVLSGIALNPHTPVSMLEPLQNFFNRVLIMTVNPGFSGQKIIPGLLKKVEQARALFPTKDIVVDGGVNLSNVKDAHTAGANVIVLGSALFQATNRQQCIEDIRAKIS